MRSSILEARRAASTRLESRRRVSGKRVFMHINITAMSYLAVGFLKNLTLQIKEKYHVGSYLVLITVEF